MALNRTQRLIGWALRILIAAILFQTLFFKFTGAAESVYIFSKIGLEPVGRIGSGVFELIAVILLLLPATVAYGALLSLGAASGAIMFHLTTLGIAVPNADGTSDGGLLFGLAITVLLGSAVVLLLHRAAIPVVGQRLFGGRACF